MNMKKSFNYLLACAIILICGCSGNHLINNKEYRSKVESSFKEREQLAQNRKDKLFNVFGAGLSLQQEEALKFLFAYMPLSDLADYNGDFFLANTNIALKTRKESPWGKDIPEEIFLHYVLSSRIFNEELDSFRIAYYDEIQQRVKGLDAKKLLSKLITGASKKWALSLPVGVTPDLLVQFFRHREDAERCQFLQWLH